MATYFPPKKNTALVMYVSLVSQANTKAMQSNPTIAAGDFKVSIDGGALNNLATLPVVTPAASKLVKIDLSAAEMNGDNITLVCSDATGAEWCDLVINLQTTARQIDDLAFPTVSGRSLDVTATGAAGIDWANVENPTTALNLSATNIDVDQVVASVSGAVGSVTGAVGSVTGNVGGNVAGSVGSVTAPVTAGTVSDKTGYSLSAAGVQAIWDALTAALTTVGSIGRLLVTNIDATISSRLASAGYTVPPTANQNADALLDRTDAIEVGATPRQSLRLMLAALAGKLSGAATNTVTIRNAVADSKNRITATVDANGNRTAVATDVS
jgi:hypothetical protein